MSCNVPTDICFSFTGFQARGGLTDEHQDGWGIAFFEGKGVRHFLDSKPSSQSPIAELVRNYPIKSKNVIAHIRKATQGQVRLENTHPFMRELWGYYWIFAHNGNLPDFAPVLHAGYSPVGTTDSERAFCYILQSLKMRFGDEYPGEEAMFAAVTELAKELGAKGEFNFLLSNGELLYAHCSTHLAFVQRSQPFQHATLKDEDMMIDFQEHTKVDDRVSIIATVPLTTDEEWTTLSAGTLCGFYGGVLIHQVATVAGPKDAPSPV